MPGFYNFGSPQAAVNPAVGYAPPQTQAINSFLGSIGLTNQTPYGPPAPSQQQYGPPAPGQSTTYADVSPISYTPPTTNPSYVNPMSLPDYQTFQGQQYNVHDPAQAQALANAQRNYYQTQYNQNSASAQQSYDQAQSQFAKDAQDLTNQQQNYLAQYNPTTGQGLLTNSYNNYLTNLANNRNQAYQSQAGYNSYVAPGATQSSQANQNQLISQQYNNDLNTAQQQNTQNVNQIKQALGDITANQDLLSKTQAGTDLQYRNTMAGLQNALQSGQDTAGNFLDALKNQANQYAAQARSVAPSTQYFDPLDIQNQFKNYIIQASQLAQLTGQPINPLQLQAGFINNYAGAYPGINQDAVQKATSPLANSSALLTALRGQTNQSNQ